MPNSVHNTLRIVEESGINRTDKATLRCALARELMQAGDYEGGSVALGNLWRGVGQKPEIENLDEQIQALVLLCAGSLTGWLGSVQQISGAQEQAKDLIGESLRRFEALGLPAKVVEAQTELGFCYWREGAYDEARVVMREALARFDADVGDEETKAENAELKALVLIRSSIIEFKTQRFAEALALLTTAEPLVELTSNHALKGILHMEKGLNLRNLANTSEGKIREAYIDQVLVEYAAGGFHYEEAGHLRYSARLTNNLGFLFFTLGKFTEAHEHLERARTLFMSLDDAGSVAQVEETRARVFLAEHREDEAERAARASVVALERGSERAILAEALATHGVALARLGRHIDARSALDRAVEEAERAGDLDGAGKAALTLIEELGKTLTLDQWQSIYERADSLLNNTTHTESLARLRSCAQRIITMSREWLSKISAASHEPELNSQKARVEKKPTQSLPDTVKDYEAQLIKSALDANKHSVTKAAAALGVSHQALSAILHHRHQGLLQVEKPRKRRRQRIIGVTAKKHKSGTRLKRQE